MAKINVYEQNGPEVPMVSYVGDTPQIGSSIIVTTDKEISIFVVKFVNIHVNANELYIEQFGFNTRIDVIVDKV